MWVIIFFQDIIADFLWVWYSNFYKTNNPKVIATDPMAKPIFSHNAIRFSNNLKANYHITEIFNLHNDAVDPIYM